MEDRGEWARMRALSHSSNNERSHGNSTRLYRFMPPPANINDGTTAESNTSPAVPSLFTGDDAIDPFASDELEAESNSLPNVTDQQLFEQAGAEPRNHWNPSHTSPSLFPQSVLADSDWRMEELGDIRRTLLGGSAPAAAAASSTSSRLAPVTDLQVGGEYQTNDEFPLPANKRARTTDPFDSSGSFYSPRDTVSDSDAFNFPPSTHFHSSNSSVASTGSNNSTSKKKRFHKSYSVSQQRHVVPTLATPIGEGNNEDADEENDNDQANDQQTQQQQSSNRHNHHLSYHLDTSSLSTLSAAASSTSEISLPRATSSSSSASARVAWTTGRHGDSASTRLTSPSRVARMVSAAGITSFRKPSVYTPPTAASSVLRQTQSSSLASTGQMWIGDFSKGAVMDQPQIQQRLDFLKQQVSEPNHSIVFSSSNPNSTFPHLTLSPTFFSMALSLLMRQNTLTSDQTDNIFHLIDIAVNNQLVPAALLNKFTQHLSESTHHFPQHQLRLAQLETMLESQVAGTMFAAVESSVAHTHSRPTSANGSSDTGKKVFLSQLPQAHSCPVCGLNMVANNSAYQAHVTSCQMAKQQERLRAARAAAAQEKRHVSDYVAQLIRTTSQYKSTNPTPAYSASAGTSKSEAISISDSDDDTATATKKEKPIVETEQAKLERISTTQRLSLEESLRFIKSSFDEFISSQRLPLVDPLTLTRIEIPIRSIKCTHVRCVDLAIFLGYLADAIKRKDPVKCMVCRQIVDIREIKVDSFIQARIQESATSQAEEVILHSDGSYEFVGANGATIGSSGGAAAASSQSNSSSMPSSTPTLQKQTSDGSGKRKKEVHTVDLLDDDEDEPPPPAPKHHPAAPRPSQPNPAAAPLVANKPAVSSSSSSSSSSTTSSSDAEESASESGSARGSTSSSSEPSHRARRRSQLGFKRPRPFPRSTSPGEAEQNSEDKRDDDDRESKSGQSDAVDDEDESSTDASEPAIAKVYARAFGPRRSSSQRLPAASSSSSSTLRPRHVAQGQQTPRPTDGPRPAEIDLTLSSDESEIHAHAAPPRRVVSASASLSNSTPASSSFPLSNPSAANLDAAQGEDSRTAMIDAISAAALAATRAGLFNNGQVDARNDAAAAASEDAMMKAAEDATDEISNEEAIAAALAPDLNMFTESFTPAFSPEQLAAAAREHESHAADLQLSGSAPAYSPFPVHPPSLSTLSPPVQNSAPHESPPVSEKA